MPLYATFSINSLCSYAVPIVGHVTELQKAKIDDQARIFDVQRELIVRGDEELKAVQTMLPIKMKTEQLPSHR